MGRTGVLGSFEELLLLALLHQGRGAYAVSIRRELVRRSGSEVAMGAVYATLERLEDRGLVRPRDAASSEGRRGRPRRYYDILPLGVAELERTRRVRASLWEGIDLDGAVLADDAPAPSGRSE